MLESGKHLQYKTGATMNTLNLITHKEIEENFIFQQHLLDIIKNRKITPYFQPIVDLYTGDIYGYEVLSRAEYPFENPEFMFEKAREWNLSWEIEYACRSAALRSILKLPQEFRDKKFFLNVSPHIFSDPRFLSGTSCEKLKLMELSPCNFVIEITETASIDDYPGFEKIIQYYVNHGFHIALDDFGAGHSGLITLVAMTPHYLKFDRALISDVNNNSYKQNLIKAIIAFSLNVETSLIAEGIETEGEFNTIFRMGVRYGQGYFLGRPSPDPAVLSQNIHDRITGLIESKKRSKFSFNLPVSSMAIKPYTVQAGSMNCAGLDSVFNSNPKTDHVVIINDRRPVSILTRLNFYSILGGRYGYSLFQKKFIDTIANYKILSVNENTDLRTVGNLAMNRKPDQLYDPVIVIDEAGGFIGTVTMKQVINNAFDIEIKIATGSNPLTHLPGNLLIGFWFEEMLQMGNYTVLYCDLDHFKEYNDTYGFTRGDEVLKSTARLLSDFTDDIPDTKLGHIGGDDFIIVSRSEIDERKLQLLCDAFDRKRDSFFTPEHAQQGFYSAVNRHGKTASIPLLSLSIAVLTEKNFSGTPHPGQIGQIAAMLKKQVKILNLMSGKSGFLADRRINNP